KTRPCAALAILGHAISNHVHVDAKSCGQLASRAVCNSEGLPASVPGKNLSNLDVGELSRGPAAASHINLLKVRSTGELPARPARAHRAAAVHDRRRAP